MLRKTLAALAFLIIASVAFLTFVPRQEADADWRTDQIAEHTAITAAAKTTDQWSAVIQKPQNAKGVIAWIDITAGTDIALDINIYAYKHDDDDLVAWSTNCPSDGGLTTLVDTICTYVSPGTDNQQPNDFISALPTFFKFSVDHTTANAATYTLYYYWIF